MDKLTGMWKGRNQGRTDIELNETGIKQKGLINFADPNENRHGIEPLPAFRRRIIEFFDYVLNNYPGKEILVVTHAGISIYAKCYFEGEPKDGDYNKYKLKNCEVLQYENDLEHNKFYNNKSQHSTDDEER